MDTLRFSLGLPLVLFACNSTERPTQTAPGSTIVPLKRSQELKSSSELIKSPPDEVRPRFVLLKSDEKLYRTPNEEDTAFRSIGYKIGQSPLVTTYRLVSEHGDWLELENLPGLDKGNPTVCAPLHEPGLGQLRLQLFARRESLHPVLTKSVRQDFDNGTRLELKPGLAMVPPNEKGLRSIHQPWLTLAATISDELIGFSYFVDEPFPEQESTTDLLNAVSMDTLDNGGVTYGDGLVLSGLNNLRIVQVNKSTEKHLVELRRDCIRVRAIAAKLSPIGNEGLISSTVDTGDPSVETQIAKVGAPVYWRDGSQAGNVVAYDLVLGVETDRSGTNRCFRHEMRDNDRERVKPRPALDLCFGTDAVTTRLASNEKRGWLVNIESSFEPAPRSLLKHLGK